MSSNESSNESGYWSPIGYSFGTMSTREQNIALIGMANNLIVGGLGSRYNYITARTFYRGREKLVTNGSGRLMASVSLVDSLFCTAKLLVGLRVAVEWLASGRLLMDPLQCYLWGHFASLFSVSFSIVLTYPLLLCECSRTAFQVLFFGLSLDRFQRASDRPYKEPKYYVHFCIAGGAAFGLYASTLVALYFPHDQAVACVCENAFFTAPYASRKLPVSGLVTWATILINLGTYLRIFLLRQKKADAEGASGSDQAAKRMRDTGRSVLWMTGVYSACWVGVMAVDFSDLLLGSAKLTGEDRLRAAVLQNSIMAINYSTSLPFPTMVMLFTTVAGTLRSYLIYRFRFTAFREQLKADQSVVLSLTN